MDVSGWSVGVGIGALAAAAAAWAWRRQQRLVAELARRLEESEHSRLDLEAHAHQVDDQLASMAEALARQQAALKSARVLPPGAASAAPCGPVRALLQHLGDTGPTAIEPAGDWVDTQPFADPGDLPPASPYPAFAETLPAEFVEPPAR